MTGSLILLTGNFNPSLTKEATLRRPENGTIVIFPEVFDGESMPRLVQFNEGRYLAKRAAEGERLVVISHSDHILNGIRSSIRKKEVSPELVKFFLVNDGEFAKEILIADKILLVNNSN